MSPDSERASIARNRSRLFVGSPATLMAKLQPMITASQADELMIITAVYDHEARKKSYDLLADAFGLAVGRNLDAERCGVVLRVSAQRVAQQRTAGEVFRPPPHMHCWRDA